MRQLERLDITTHSNEIREPAVCNPALLLSLYWLDLMVSISQDLFCASLLVFFCSLSFHGLQTVQNSIPLKQPWSMINSFSPKPPKSLKASYTENSSSALMCRYVSISHLLGVGEGRWWMEGGRSVSRARDFFSGGRGFDLRGRPLPAGWIGVSEI